MLARFAAKQIKHNAPFLVGLTVGLLIAVGAPVDRPAPCGVDLGDVPDVEPVSAAPVQNEPPVQRPRYYRSELGMREPALVAALAAPEALPGRAALLNASAAGVLPIRLFTASPAAAALGRSNVVAFTDSRRLLQPFHMLKYLADNYLEQYNYFLLLEDRAALNARRLLQLSENMSVSHDVYMGVPSQDNTDYCLLESGILLSNSVLRAVHSSLDWCVRNSYSIHHYENIGRCVLHATKLACTTQVQGQKYESVSAPVDGTPWPPLATVASVVTGTDTNDMRTALHAIYTHLIEETEQQIMEHTNELAKLVTHHPPNFQNQSWPSGTRVDAGMLPHTPIDRFDDLRWTWFNKSHAMMFDDHEPVTLLTPIYKRAVKDVLQVATDWMHRKYGHRDVTLREGLWRWQPAQGLEYRLTMESPAGVHLLQVFHILGPPSILPVPYVTESTPLHLLLPMPPSAPHPRIASFISHFSKHHSGVSLTVLQLSGNYTRPPLANVDVLTYDRANVPPTDGPEYWSALRWAVSRMPKDALVLLAHHDMEYNDDFLNRVRMNTIRGHQWFAPMPLQRPILTPSRGKFTTAGKVLSFYRTDLEAAYASLGTHSEVSPHQALGSSPLVCLSAPEPALVMAAPTADEVHQCAIDPKCRHSLYFGERQAVATMLFEDGALS